MSKLQKLGGIAAISEGLNYMLMFVFWGAILSFPSDGSNEQKLAFIAENQISIYVMNLVGYVLFGVMLAVLVQALYNKLKDQHLELVQLASIFGLIWVGIIITGGMVANLGMQSVIELSLNEPEQARSVWLANNIVVEGLGGGIEIVGGLWMLLISVATFNRTDFSKALSVLGLIIGAVGVLTLYPSETLPAIFGLGQIVWFIWLGITMLTVKEEQSYSGHANDN